MDLHGIWTFVRFHWVTLVLAGAMGAAVGFGMASASEREYTAESELFIAVTNGSDTGGIAQGADYSQQQARNFSAVATREIVLEPVITRLDLNITVGELRRKVSSSVPLNTSIISITATDTSPEQASQIANATAQSLVSSANRLTPKPADDESLVRVRSIESAAVPTQPSAPNTKLFIILWALLGLVVAVAAVTVRDLSKAKVRTAEQVRSIVGANLIGSIMADRSVPKAPMVLVSAPSSIRAEEFRQLRTNLRFLQTDHAQKAFVVTSSIAQEGKSTISANLAAAIAASGARVCLVEADLRRPSLGGILDLEDGVGLTTLLTGEAVLDDVLQPWGEDGLMVLLAGEIPPNPSELLGTAGAESILREVVERFDVTIIDSPPLNPVTDGSILARLFGGAILVVGSKKVELRELHRAVERMALVDAEVLGTVLSMAPSSVMSRYRHSYSPRTTPTTAPDPSVLQARTESVDPVEPVDSAKPVDTAEQAETAESIDPVQVSDDASSDEAGAGDEIAPEHVASDEPMAEPTSTGTSESTKTVVDSPTDADDTTTGSSEEASSIPGDEPAKDPAPKSPTKRTRRRSSSSRKTSPPPGTTTSDVDSGTDSVETQKPPASAETNPSSEDASTVKPSDVSDEDPAQQKEHVPDPSASRSDPRSDDSVPAGQRPGS